MTKQRYQCSQCGNTTTVYVRLTEPPTCTNKHAAKPMEKTK